MYDFSIKTWFNCFIIFFAQISEIKLTFRAGASCWYGLNWTLGFSYAIMLEKFIGLICIWSNVFLFQFWFLIYIIITSWCTPHQASFIIVIYRLIFHNLSIIPRRRWTKLPHKIFINIFWVLFSIVFVFKIFLSKQIKLILISKIFFITYKFWVKNSWLYFL